MDRLNLLDEREPPIRIQEQARGFAAEGWLRRIARWWRERSRLEQRRQARRKLFVLESLMLGPKQRVVLMRCGRERFLVGLGTDGVRTIVPVPSRRGSTPVTGSGVRDGRWV